MSNTNQEGFEREDTTTGIENEQTDELGFLKKRRIHSAFVPAKMFPNRKPFGHSNSVNSSYGTTLELTPSTSGKYHCFMYI